MTKFYDRCYIGIGCDSRHDNKGEEFPLGFMTYVDSTKAFEKRVQTIKEWAEPRGYYSKSDKTARFYELDNTPVDGIQIEKSVSRRRGNKLFRVTDPRGFTLEISAANLFNIIDTCTVSKGMIQDTVIWGRDGGQNVLVNLQDADYLARNDPSKKKKRGKNFKPNAVVKDAGSGTHFFYAGTKMIQSIKCVTRYDYTHYSSFEQTKTQTYVDQGLIGGKPMHMYIEKTAGGFHATFRKTKMITLTDPTESLTADDFILPEWFPYYVASDYYGYGSMCRIVEDGTEPLKMHHHEIERITGEKD